MKRDATGKFVQNWDSETKQRISISLTCTAWRSLDKEAQKRGISRSEVVEHFARNLETEPSNESTAPDAPVALIQNQLLEQEQENAALQRQKQELEARLEQALNTSAQTTERKVATILESITDAFVAFDRDWHYTYVNQAAAQILHKTPEELLGKHVWNDVFPELVGGVAYQAMHQAVAEQVPVTWEEFGKSVQCWLEANAYPSAEGIAVYFRNVTERKQAEAEREQLLQALETERAKFEAVLHQMPAGVFIADAISGKLVLANEQAKQIVKYDFEETRELEDYVRVIPFEVFRSNGQIYAPDEYPLMRSLKTGEVIIREEMELRQEDGSYTVISVNSSPILDKQERILATVAVFQDITERKQTETLLRQQTEALENQQKWLEAVLDLMPTPTVFIEPETARVTFSNRIANELAGGDLPKDKSLDEYTDVYYCTDANGDRIPTERMPAVLIAQGERLENYEMNWYTPGGIRSTLCWGETLPAMHGHPAIGIGMFQDVTRLKQIEESLRQTEERLQLALASAEMIAWDTDFTTNQVVCSPNALEIFGMHVGTAEAFRAVIHPDDRPLVWQALEQAIAGDHSFSEEYRVISPDDTILWLKSQGRVYLDEAGQATRMLGVSVNITERKQIEAERDRLLEREQASRRLAEKERQRLRDILMQVPAMFAVLSGSDHVFELANSKFLTVSGRSEDILGKTAREVFPEIAGQGYSEIYDRVYQTGEIIREEECFSRWDSNRDGNLVEGFFNFVFLPLRDIDGCIDSILIHGIEVTAQVQARQQAEVLLQELQRKERQQQFLIELNDAIRAFQHSEEIMWQVVSSTGQYFNVTRCTYGEIDPTQEYVIVDHDYCNGVISVVGSHRMNSFGLDIITELKQGKTVVVEDVDRDPRTAGSGAAAFDAIQTKSLLCVPLVKAGRFEALLVLHHVAPRQWTAEEVALLERIAEKTWLAVERSRAEAELREREAHLQLALKVGRMGTWDWDLQTGTLLWSAGHFTILDLQPDEDEPSYELWRSRVHPDDLAETETKLQRATQERTEYHHEYRLRWADGSVHWVEARGQFSYDAQGQPKHSIGVVIDITERKQAEETLHQTLQKLNFHVENTPMAVVEWDHNFRVIRWSAGAERILGWKAEEILGRSLTEIPFVFEADLEAVSDVCQRLVYGEEPHIFSSNRNYTKDRNVVHCEWYNSSLRDKSGRMTSVLSLVSDVTERKQAEQEREQLIERERLARSQSEAAQQQLATLFETSPIGLALLDADQRFIAINEALAEINGLTREQHLGYSIPDLFGQPDPKLVEVFHQIYLTGEPFISPSFAVNVPGRNDRRPGYYNVYYLPTINANHQVESILVYVVDVTERVRLERAQQFLSEASAVLASSLDYQTTLERVAQLIVPELADWCTVHIVEEDNTIDQIATAHINPAKLEWAHQLQEKYPLDPNAARGAALTLRTGLPDFVPEIPDELLVQAARDPEHLEILRQVGFNSVMTVPLRTQARIIGVISFISAESGRRYTAVDLQLAEELAHRASLAIDNAQLYEIAQRDRAKAEAANRIKDEFLAVLSHELRTPLNPILGWTRMLRTKHLNATKTDQALDTIERNAKLQAQLIEDLLDVSRILQGKMSLNIAPVNLAITIEAALETVRLAAEAKQLQIQTTLNSFSGSVLGDTNRLQQVVWNLLSNAVKFTPSSGRVEVCLEQVGTHAQIQVKDTGKGIHPEFLPHVFDYFRQEDGGTTRHFGGLGLGLAIVRQLVELHGGSVWAESLGPDLGATFVVRLPLNQMEQAPASETENAEAAVDLTGIRVLVVDDEADMRELASFILTQAGAQVTTASSAAETLFLLNQSVPDLLLCDIGMPEMNGYSLIQQIRKWSPDQGGTLKAISLTAYAGEVNQQQALAAGFQMHLSKPVEPEELVKAVSSLIATNAVQS
ncbi:PAS domain S-box protein [Leptolyngbya sp. FACHB-17]|uniref:PAS domain S-box protein n=1 Tax=unclassified Leptolyngbya TaxID=2650499 RepID=UPI001F5537B6|nr:PAS domain S-box protein [Leptolyngbya sp. FACHB-17]